MSVPFLSVALPRSSSSSFPPPVASLCLFAFVAGLGQPAGDTGGRAEENSHEGTKAKALALDSSALVSLDCPCLCP
jgi:hypothetical protein